MTVPSTTFILTGATGFIGSALLEQLIARGHKVIVLLRPGSDQHRIATLRGFDSFFVTQLDDPQLVEQLRTRQPAVLIHSAWRGVAGKERNAPYQITESLPLTIDSVKLAIACGCLQWIGLGSQAEYGNLNRIISETAPALPTTLYGKAKLAAGVAALAFCEAAGLTGTWLRIFSTYGPGDASTWFIPFVIREFLNGRTPQVTPCEQLWDYLYITDAIDAILSTAEKNAGGVFNLGSGEALPLRRIIEIIREQLGTSIQPAYGAVPYRPDQVMHLQADISKLRAATGWSPRFSFEQGLRETIASERKLFAVERLVRL